MTTSEMTDRELNKAIAEAMGFHPDVVRAGGYKPDVARYTESIDLLSAVEQRLRDAGWWFDVRWASPESGWFVRLIPPAPSSHQVEASALTESRARAEAALLALRAVAEPPETTNRTNWPDPSITTLASSEG